MTISKSFLQRLLFGCLAAFLGIFSIYYSSLPWMWLPFSLVVFSIIFCCLYEYFTFVEAVSIRPRKKLGYLLSFAYFFSLVFFTHTYWGLVLPKLFLLFSLILPFLVTFQKNESPLFSLATTLFGLVWITLPLTTLFQINYYFPISFPQSGSRWLLFLIVVAKMCDVMAYVFGKQLGKNKLAPFISPKKTVEGAVAGTVFAVVTAYLFAQFGFISLHWLEASLLGLVIALLAQLGDLAESLIKRDVGVKDSNKLPGLGGVLDMFDSLIFSSPFLYIYLIYKWPEFYL